jgi:hypothetical protein
MNDLERWTQERDQEEKRLKSLTDGELVQDSLYYINNPSSWASYEESKSLRLRELCSRVQKQITPECPRCHKPLDREKQSYFQYGMDGALIHTWCYPDKHLSSQQPLDGI